MEYWGYELGPIRPPSEAHSLLIRITRNCHWNRCTFCPVYKEKEFSRRTVDHIKRDIDLIATYVDQLKSVESEVDEMMLVNQVHPVNRFGYTSALIWFRNGMRSVFLQDADSLIIPPSEIIDILNYLTRRFPDIERITSYARSSTIAKIADDDLKAIAKAGLNRIHIGLESGSDTVLKKVRKGASKCIHISAGRKIREAGMELSEYMIPGLGGRRYSYEHAIESADVLNQINPDFIRLRQLATPSSKDLFEDFERCSDIDVVQELRLFVEYLDVKNTWIVSDHILNLLPDIEGTLPNDKERILKLIDHFLNLDQIVQTQYQLGRRLGLLQSLNDLLDSEKMKRVIEIYESKGITVDNIDDIVSQLMQQFI